MDFLNKALAQLSDLFRSMTPAARITTALLLVVIVVSVAYLFNHQLSGGDAYLFGGAPVPPGELAAMEAAFSKKGLSDYNVEGARIRVPRGKQSAYMGALADAGALPHAFGDSLKRMLESNSPWVNQKTQEGKAKYALQDELAKIIRKMSGIENAMVLFDSQTQLGLTPKKLVTASVSVQPLGKQSLSTEQVRMIRLVVSGAIAGLAPESVSVVDLNGRAYPGGTPGNSSDVSQDRYLNTKQEYEQQYTDSIRQALQSFINSAVVTVNVELHTELEQTESSSKVDPKTVPVDVSEQTKTSSSSAPQVGGRPGLAAQGGVNAPATISAAGSGSRTEEESSDRHERNIASVNSIQVKKAGLTPKRVSVSVGVPSSYYEEVWQQRNPTPQGTPPKKPDAAALTQIETEMRTSIKSHVVGVLPTLEDPGKDPTPLVTVTTFQHLPTPELAKPSTADHALVWFSDNASAIGMGLFGIVSLLMVRSIVRAVPAAVGADLPEQTAAEAPLEAASEAEPPRADAPARLRRRRSTSGPSLRDELVDIVRDDPDAAANILRSWIGTAN